MIDPSLRTEHTLAARANPKGRWVGVWHSSAKKAFPAQSMRTGANASGPEPSFKVMDGGQAISQGRNRPMAKLKQAGITVSTCSHLLQ